MIPRKEQRARNAKISRAAEDRKKHFEKVARSIGCKSAEEAHKRFGKEFIKLAHKGAPSINNSLNAQ